MDTKKLRQKILDLAIRGKLVPQDPNDEPASVLLERIKAEKEQLIKEGKIKRGKKSESADKSHYENVPFEIPGSWCWCRLSELCVFLSRGKSPKYSEERIYPVFAQKCNLKDGGISLNQARFLDPNTIDKWDSIYKLRNGDVLVNSTGTGTVGRTRLFNESCLGEYPFVVPDSHVSVIRTTQHIKSTYVLLLLTSNWGQQYIEDNLAGSTNQKELYIGVLEDMLIPLPPKEEQRRITDEVKKWSDFVNNIDNAKSELSENIKNIKSKILNLAISSKLVSQDPDDEPAIELLKRINPDFKPCDNSHYEKLPNGWCVCRLEDILDYEQPQSYIVNSTDYSNEYETPVLTAGKSFIIGYTNEVTGICNKLPVIIFDDFTTDSKLVDFPFKVKSSAMKILRVKGEVNINYVALFMSITRLIGDTHKRYWISEYSKIPIPIPPYQEQERIVENIDVLFNELDTITSELL